MSEVVAKWTLSESYYRSYWRDSVKHRTLFRRWTVPFGIFLLALGGTLLWISEANDGIDFVPWALILIGVYELVWHFLDKGRWFRLVRKGNQAGGEVELRLNRDGIDHVGPTASGRIKWQGIEKFVRAENGLFLAQGRGLSIYIPYTSLSEEREADEIEVLYHSASAA